MPKFMTLTAAAISVMLLAQPVFAHPHKTDETSKTEKEAKKDWPNFGDDDSLDLSGLAQMLEKRFGDAAEDMAKSADRAKIKIEKRRLKNDGEDAGTDIREAAKSIEMFISESGMISNMADLVADLAEDIEIEADGDGATVLLFDGQEMAHFKLDSQSSNKMRIGGLGQNLSIERNNAMKNGKSRTRITIEMDGGNDIEIELPDLKETEKSKPQE